MRFPLVVFCAAVAPLLICGSANAERIADPSLGFTVEIPRDWSELPTTQVNKGLNSFENDNPQIAEAVRKHGFVPRHLFGRIPNPASPFSASVNVSTQPATPLKGQSEQQALLALLVSSEQEMPHVEVVTAPEIVTLAGNAAGHIALTSRVNVGGGSIPIVTEPWVIPRGSYYVALGATYDADPKSGDRAEVMQIVNSLKFVNTPAVGE